jgi:hypothetical protein
MPCGNINIGMTRNFTYAEVESAMATALEMLPNKRPAFAARLRHLRNLGLPKTRPGSGQRVSYSRADAEQMFFALLLEGLGCSPLVAVRASRVGASFRKSTVSEFLVLLPKRAPLLVSAQEASALIREEPAVVLVNLPRAALRLEAALAETASARFA